MQFCQKVTKFWLTLLNKGTVIDNTRILNYEVGNPAWCRRNSAN